MSRRHNEHQQRQQAVAALGRTLSRRARSACELCEGTDGTQPMEVEPVFESPDVQRAVLACARCRALPTAKRLSDEAASLRFLEQTVWSETLPAQLMAVRLVRQLAAADIGWARDCAEGLWLDEAVEALI